MQKFLFVCTVNRLRSKTADTLFQGLPDFEVKSTGTDAEATVQVNRELLEWAEYMNPVLVELLQQKMLPYFSGDKV